MSFAAIAVGVVGLGTAVYGGVQASKAKKEQNKLFSQRKAYQTPQEIIDIVNMTKNNAQSGFSPETLQYLTGQADIGLGSSLGAATLLGADPNMLGGLADNYFQDIFKIGNQNELVKMQKFDQLINATQLLAGEQGAEWASQENLLKDQLQAAGSRRQAANATLNSGINTALSGVGTYATGQLYKNQSNLSQQELLQQALAAEGSKTYSPSQF